MIELVEIGLATSAASMTLGVSRICLPLRHWAVKRGQWVGHLAHCPYCLSHWVALFLVLGYHPGRWLPVEWLAAVTIAQAGNWLILKFLDDLEGEK